MSHTPPSSLGRWIEGRPSRRSWSRRAEALPADDQTCGWLETATPPPKARRLQATISADFAIVGAGFTGLAAARRLAELRPDSRIVVLEAQQAGFGAAGRSSGFVVDLAHFVARLRPEDSRRYVRVARAAIQRLREWVDEQKIDCDWDDEGWLHVAAGEEAERSLGMLRAWLDGQQEPYHWLDDGALRDLTGIGYYRAGIRLPGSVLVQPAALVRGMAYGQREAVELYEESPVEAIEGRAGRFRLRTEEGSVDAGTLIVATNGYAPSLGILHRRVLPLFTFGSLTRPLTQAEQESLGGRPEWGILAEDAMGSTVRRTRDQRILIRNLVDYSRSLKPRASRLEEARAFHQRAFDARFPMLSGVDMEFTWGGAMGVTPSRNVWFGEYAEGLFTAGGYSGAGIAMGAAAGHHLAELACGERTSLLDDIHSLPQPGLLPPQPFLGIGAGFRVGRMNAQAGDHA